VKIEQVEGILVGSDMIGANYVVRITTDTGLSGVGQSGAWGFPDAVQKVVEQYAEYLVGEDPFRIEHISQALYRLRPFRGSIVSGALSAIDIALWDLKAKHFEVPVWQLLGGKSRDSMRLHLFIEPTDPEGVRREAREAAEMGFTAVKYDPFQPGYQDQALPAIIAGARDMAAAGREAVGDDVDLIFELHRKLTPMQSVPIAAALAEFDPLFIEDPIQIDSIPRQAELAGRYTSPLASGERLNTIWEFSDLFESGGPQHVRPDLGLAGGLTGCRKIAAIAEAHHSALIPHNFLGPVLTAASAHLCTSIPNFLTLEYILRDESDRPAETIFRSRLKREGGRMLAPDGPGLGVEIDDELLAEAPARYLSATLPLREDGFPALAQ
jgi:galactonate dehydratase